MYRIIPEGAGNTLNSICIKAVVQRQKKYGDFTVDTRERKTETTPALIIFNFFFFKLRLCTLPFGEKMKLDHFLL